jgi:hypothetical protein
MAAEILIRKFKDEDQQPSNKAKSEVQKSKRKERMFVEDLHVPIYMYIGIICLSEIVRC